MKIIVVGGAGTIGKAVVAELAARHEIIVAGRTHGDVQVDITDTQSIKKMYQSVGQIDAVVSTAGSVHFGPLLQMTEAELQIGLRDKLMGQVQLVLQGVPFIKPNGSFTVTSGILSQDPIRYGASASMVNGALDSFVKGAALELPNIRINAVSPTIVTESLESYGPYFYGFPAVDAAKVAKGFSKSVEGAQTGQIYSIWQ